MYSSSDLNKIKNIDSRRNFEYVLQSYYSNNNKSAILLLYNLLVNDLYNKLILMNENGYVNLQSDLDNIENNLKDSDESKYSVIEEKIFDIYKAKKILNTSTIDLLVYFKKIRNKCAHPFFFKENDYTPSNEEVYLFITKIYNEILIVETFFKNPYDVMKKDIEAFSFPSLESILMGFDTTKDNLLKTELFFTKKYYKFMTDNNFIKLFKSFMDLAICKNSSELLPNQYKHYLLLCSLLNYLKKQGKMALLDKKYNWDKLKIENIYDDIDKTIDEQQCFTMSYLYRVLSYNNSFIEELKDENDGVFELIKTELYKKSYLFIEFWQLFDINIDDALKKISNDISYKDCYNLITSIGKIISRNNLVDLLHRLLIKIPTFNSFNKADETLELLIKIISEISPKFKQEEIECLFELMNSNRQIYDKSRNWRNNQINRIKEFGYNLDAYENLKLEEDD